jgi:arylsulfatase A-like enzyme
MAALLPGFGCDAPVPFGELRARLAGIERPNLVLILFDTLRPDWTSPYGFDDELTPELQRWADDGVLFERALAQSSWTKISMASLFTSLWPQSHGIRLVDDGLSGKARTLPQILRDAGYRTYGVQSNGWLEQSFGFQHGFERYIFPRSPESEGLNRASIWPHGENVLEESGRLLEAHDPNEPFFLYLHFMDVHEYAAPPELKTLGGGKRGAYLASIRWMDELLGMLQDQISDGGAASRTIWIFGPRGIVRGAPVTRARLQRLHPGAPRPLDHPLPVSRESATHRRPGPEPRHRADGPGSGGNPRSGIVPG